MERERLDKCIAAGGAHSRSAAKELIRRGRVTVNGERATGPEQKVGPGDRVAVDGAPLRGPGNLYIMLNKPAGVVCATRDRDHPTVLELLPPELCRRGLFPAGRLDKDTEGFVLLTDDGPFAHRILSPRSHVPKTYLATLSGEFDETAVAAAFAAGVTLDGGEVCSPARLTVRKNGTHPEVELTIYEGRYHQVKRMFALFSLHVDYLKRIRIGGLELDPGLAKGGAREILHKELSLIS